jgi:glycosyltransferase involved in cell wall biosynthesis
MSLIDLGVQASGRRPAGRRLLSWGVDAYDRWLCSRAVVAGQATSAADPSMGFTYSVGIAHHNRGSLIARPLRNLLNHKGVSEVVIVDDGSRESEYEALQEQVRLIDKAGRVKIHRRDENRGALLTKLECVEKCSSDWVLVLDSDNTAFTGYLDRLEALVPSDPGVIYCAAWAYPYFPFDELSGMSIDFKQACDFLQNGILKRKYLLNDGNYLVNRRRYSEVVSLIGRLPSDVVDVLVVNYLWLSKGGKLGVIPGTKYMHRVDPSSFWSQTAEASKKRLLEIYARMEGAVPWDEDFLQKLRSGLV